MFSGEYSLIFHNINFPMYISMALSGKNSFRIMPSVQTVLPIIFNNKELPKVSLWYL